MTRHCMLSRRRFLAGATASILAAPSFTRNLISAPPSGRVRHASFGANGMAGADIRGLSASPNFQLVAAAEVDAARAVDLVKKFPDVKIYPDWRVMLEEERELDSVNVSTPDHMHAPMGMSALQRGLHVYGQKPLTHDLYESRRLAEVAKEKGLVTQMGIQIHSHVAYRSAVLLVQGGAIGKVREVHTWSSKKWGDPNPRPDRVDPVPADFDWDLWLGVAAERPFIKGYYHPGQWRKRLDFGTGTFGDMGCHIYDPVFKALALTSPLTLRSEGEPPNAHSWSQDAVIRYVFPGNEFTLDDTVAVTWYDGDKRPPQLVLDLLGDTKVPSQGSIFIGTKGLMVLPHIGNPILLPEADYADYPRPELDNVSHWVQFVDAVRGEGRTSAHFGYAGPLTEAVLLGGVASRFPQVTLEWDAQAMRFPNLPEADALVRRTYRKGWEVAGL